MTLDVFLLYCVVSFLYIISPGPAIFLAITNGMSVGMRAVSVSSLGNILGLFILSSASMLGLGALLLTSATLFFAVKVVGAAYLIFLGVKNIRHSKSALKADLSQELPRKRYRSVFKEGFLIAVTNPKPILFFTALFPQFLNVQSNLVPQFFALTGVFMLFSFFALCSYGMVSKVARGWLSNQARMAWFHRISGGVFIAMGIGLLQLKKVSN